MTESVDRQTAVLRLRGADDILILCHKNPDGDTIGCAGALYLALKALGKNAAILCSDPIPKMYDYMELRWFDGSFNPAFVVAVDVASIQLFGENNNVPQYAAHTNLCIDHHASNSGYAYETLLDPGAAAACEFFDFGVVPHLAFVFFAGVRIYYSPHISSVIREFEASYKIQTANKRMVFYAFRPFFRRQKSFSDAPEIVVYQNHSRGENPAAFVKIRNTFRIVRF